MHKSHKDYERKDINMFNKMAIIGGDLRIVTLAKLFAEEEYEVYTYGLEKAEEIKNINNIYCCNSIKEALKNVNVVISAIPFSSNGKEINAPFSEKKISVIELIDNLNAKTLIAGSIKPEVYQMIDDESTEIIDIMKREELAVLNTIATAEGAIQIAIENTNRVLHGSKALILGFGRIGKVLAKKLEGLSVDITCSARKNEDFAWIRTYGYKALNTNHLSNDLEKFDVIINTIPYIVLDKEKLEYVKKDTLLIDLASNPGGIDQNAAKELGLNFVWALSLPGKIAPVTSAEFIKNTIHNIFDEMDNEI